MEYIAERMVIGNPLGEIPGLQACGKLIGNDHPGKIQSNFRTDSAI